MTCNCPKCLATIDVDLPEFGDEGTSASCPACNATFYIHPESFGGRALRKTGEVSCAACGGQLGPHMHCPNCGLPFPGYLVVSLSKKPPRRKVSKIRITSSPIKKRKQSSMNLPTLEAAMRQEEPAKISLARVKVKVGSRKLPVIVVSVLLVLAAAAGGGFFYLKKQAETAYKNNFVIAAYGIQVTADRSRAVCQKLAADWKTKTDAGQAFTPRPSLDDDRDLNQIKLKIEATKGKIAEEPAKFKGCNDKLNRLDLASAKLRTFALSPGNALPAFNDSLAKADNSYKQAANEFKAGLPQELMEALSNGAQKYKGLRPLLK
ncbi:MAG TPA: hypothetical protein VJ550_03710 [Geomonas sp.]|nr:hypothetical protein [Geomonas sp.]